MLPDGCWGGGENPDEEASFNARLVDARDHQVVSGLQLLTENRLSHIGVAVGGCSGGFVQYSAQTKMLLVHLGMR